MRDLSAFGPEPQPPAPDQHATPAPPPPPAAVPAIPESLARNEAPAPAPALTPAPPAARAATPAPAEPAAPAPEPGAPAASTPVEPADTAVAAGADAPTGAFGAKPTVKAPRTVEPADAFDAAHAVEPADAVAPAQAVEPARPAEPGPTPDPPAPADPAAVSDGTTTTRPAIIERRQGVDRRQPRASSRLQAAWIDPEEMPFTPQPRPGNAIASRIFSLGVLGVFLAALAWLIVPEIHFRIYNQHEIQFSQGILTARPVPLSPVQAAVVEEILIDDLSTNVSLPAGTPIARLRGRTVDGTRTYSYDLRVPFDARLVSVGAPTGTVTQPGVPVITVYDPAELMVIVTVNQNDLDLLRQDMAVKLHSPLLGKPIKGSLVSAVPILGTEHQPTASTLVNLRIRPDLTVIDGLLPGLQFDVTIDLDSVPKSAPALLYTLDAAAPLK